MKTAEEIDNWSNEIYDDLEHGNGKQVVRKLQQFQLDAFKAGMTKAAEKVETASGYPTPQSIAILTARDNLIELP